VSASTSGLPTGPTRFGVKGSAREARPRYGLPCSMNMPEDSAAARVSRPPYDAATPSPKEPAWPLTSWFPRGSHPVLSYDDVAQASDWLGQHASDVVTTQELAYELRDSAEDLDHAAFRRARRAFSS
jgi:hypothetical protein